MYASGLLGLVAFLLCGACLDALCRGSGVRLCLALAAFAFLAVGGVCWVRFLERVGGSDG